MKLKIHHLITYTSCLPECCMNAPIDLNKTHTEINKDIANFVASKDLTFEPGMQNQNNTIFVLLGLMIE